MHSMNADWTSRAHTALRLLAALAVVLSAVAVGVSPAAAEYTRDTSGGTDADSTSDDSGSTDGMIPDVGGVITDGVEGTVDAIADSI